MISFSSYCLPERSFSVNVLNNCKFFFLQTFTFTFALLLAWKRFLSKCCAKSFLILLDFTIRHRGLSIRKGLSLLQQLKKHLRKELWTKTACVRILSSEGFHKMNHFLIPPPCMNSVHYIDNTTTHEQCTLHWYGSNSVIGM